MSVESHIPGILSRYGISQSKPPERIGSGYIHFTYKIQASQGDFILQRVNKDVFRQPQIIADNLAMASAFLKKNDPAFVFATPLENQDGHTLTWDTDGYPWRLMPFMANSYTVDKVSNAAEAFLAAREFGRLSHQLHGVDVQSFRPTIDKFHDLGWRYEQFEMALAAASIERKTQANTWIEKAKSNSALVDRYRELVNSSQLQLRITHNDTKINNVLFDRSTGQTICAIDLDTLMPGYFIYDLGDMIRTFVSPVDENEKDLSKVEVRKDIYDALTNGYLSEMRSVLSDVELTATHFSGLMMTYIMALRFLTDFLNGNIYYQVSYPEHNLVRAANQFTLLDLLSNVN